MHLVHDIPVRMGIEFVITLEKLMFPQMVFTRQLFSVSHLFWYRKFREAVSSGLGIAIRYALRVYFNIM